MCILKEVHVGFSVKLKVGCGREKRLKDDAKDSAFKQMRSNNNRF